MKKRLITLAIVVLFVLTMVPFIASADAELYELGVPVGIDAPDSHWGWSYRYGTLPGLRNAIGIRIQFDHEPGEVEFVIQSPAAGWWEHPGATAVEGDTLEVIFDEWSEYWDSEDGEPSAGAHRFQSELHLVFGNWAELTPDNVVGAWIIGPVLATPIQPGTENPELPTPTVDDFGGHSHWGWSMENNSLPLNMSEITGIVIEFDFEPGAVEFIIQSPAEGTGWWDHPGATEFDGNTLEINFEDFTDAWDLHREQNQMHIVFGEWDDGVGPGNVVSAHLIGNVAEGIVDAAAGPAVELPPDGSLPFDLGLGAPIWGDVYNQLGWNGDSRAISDGAPLDGGGLTAGLLEQAQWFVIYVTNSPDDYVSEMLQLMIFGNANGWGWEEGTMEAPTMGVYDTFVPGAIAFPIAGHPYVEAIRAIGEDEFANRNFGIMFQYDGGIANLGITSVMIYAELPGAAEPDPEPEPTPEPTPEPPADDEPEATPVPADDGGFPTWGWILIALGGGAVAVVIAVVAKKKGS